MKTTKTKHGYKCQLRELTTFGKTRTQAMCNMISILHDMKERAISDFHRGNKL